MYKAMMDFVEAEWVSGSFEAGQTCEAAESVLISSADLRNKLAFTSTMLFLISYPANIPSFLHPFFDFLRPTDAIGGNFNPCLLSLHLLNEIALETHDIAIRSARPYSSERLKRDGLIRDHIRTSGDEKLAVGSLLALAEQGLSHIVTGNRCQWHDVVELALTTLAAWTRRCNLA